MRDRQLPLFAVELPKVDILSYDRVIVAYSGGKDSTACVLWAIEAGIPRERIELWHHLVDGEGPALMDWPCTKSYCARIAGALGLPIYYSWREGGFEREMLRENARTARVRFEAPGGWLKSSGGKGGKLSTRRRFPQASGNLRVRWCTAALKIDVSRAAVSGQKRLEGIRTLLVSGERAEESPCRARYQVFEPDSTDCGRRVVHHLRPVHKWSEREVWAIMERHRVNPHPCYKLGYGRCSCACCIFGSCHQWASLDVVLPEQVARVTAYEKEFGCTVHRKLSVREQIERGAPYPGMQPDDIAAARATVFDQPGLIPAGEWRLPAGAFGESTGPS
jgi:3'-phosphoadenosine 5'-phosphosulfate sulfotransferase (PAPS reductase)/FAD synthetase